MSTINILEIHQDRAILDLGHGPVTMDFEPVDYQSLSPLHAFILGMAYATYHNRGVQPPAIPAATKGEIATAKTEVI